MSRLALPLLVCLIAAQALPTPARAEVRRCVDAQGNSVFTDLDCSTMNAIPRGVPAASRGAHYSGGFGHQGCAAGPRQLLDDVRSALESRDVNLLASHYHWTGTGLGAAQSLMSRLETIAERPLVAIDLVFPKPEPVSDDDSPPLEPVKNEPAPAPVESPESLRQRPPYAIRVEQMSAVDDAGSSQTLFNLRRQAGCWFIQL